MTICVAGGAVVLLLVGATLGLALSGKFAGSDSATPDNASVDAGFARDMIVHHDQGVLMAHYAEENTTDQEIAVHGVRHRLHPNRTDRPDAGLAVAVGPAGIR